MRTFNICFLLLTHISLNQVLNELQIPFNTNTFDLSLPYDSKKTQIIQILKKNKPIEIRPSFMIPLLKLPKVEFHDSNAALPAEISGFKRRLDAFDIERGLHLMHVLDRIFTENGIYWWLSFGTLLGQKYFHSIIPWDDDFDIAAYGDFDEIIAVLDKFCSFNPEYKVQTRSDKHTKFIKFYHKDYDEIKGHVPRFPFVDIFTFFDAGDKIEAYPFYGQIVRHSKTDIFPLKRGLFHEMSFPIPKNPQKMLPDFGYFLRDTEWSVCKTGYNHRLEKSEMVFKTPCLDLRPFFQRVEIDPQSGNDVLKSAKNETIYIVVNKAQS